MGKNFEFSKTSLLYETLGLHCKILSSWRSMNPCMVKNHYDYVNLMVADVLAPNRCQDISNHHAEQAICFFHILSVGFTISQPSYNMACPSLYLITFDNTCLMMKCYILCTRPYAVQYWDGCAVTYINAVNLIKPMTYTWVSCPDFNPLHNELFWVNMKRYLHFKSFLKIKMENNDICGWYCQYHGCWWLCYYRF